MAKERYVEIEALIVKYSAVATDQVKALFWKRKIADTYAAQDITTAIRTRL